MGIGDIKDEDGSRMQGEIPKSNNPKLDYLDNDILLPPPRRCPPPPPRPPPPPPAPRPPPPPSPSPPDIIIHPCFEVRDVILRVASPDPNPGPDRPPHHTNTNPSPANALSLTMNVTASLRPQHKNPGPDQWTPIREPDDGVLSPASGGRRLKDDIGEPIRWRCPPPPSPRPPPPPRRPSKYAPPMPPVSPPPDCPTLLDFVLVLDESGSMRKVMNVAGGLKDFAKLLVRHTTIARPPAVSLRLTATLGPVNPSQSPPSPSPSPSQRPISRLFTHA